MFDDVFLVFGYVDFLSANVDVWTRFTRDLSLNIPILSAVMDIVTEWCIVVTLACEGGLGIVHKNLILQDQAKEISKVKCVELGMILDLIMISPDIMFLQVLEIMCVNEISGLPVVEGDRLVGILMSRDIWFEKNLGQCVDQLMTKELVTVPSGVAQERAKELLHEHCIEKLLVVEDDKLVGLIMIKDLLQAERFLGVIKDLFGWLRVGAVIGVGLDRRECCDALVKVGADVIVIDIVHGHS